MHTQSIQGNSICNDPLQNGLHYNSKRFLHIAEDYNPLGLKENPAHVVGLVGISNPQIKPPPTIIRQRITNHGFQTLIGVMLPRCLKQDVLYPYRAIIAIATGISLGFVSGLSPFYSTNRNQGRRACDKVFVPILTIVTTLAMFDCITDPISNPTVSSRDAGHTLSILLLGLLYMVRLTGSTATYRMKSVLIVAYILVNLTMSMLCWISPSETWESERWNTYEFLVPFCLTFALVFRTGGYPSSNCLYTSY